MIIMNINDMLERYGVDNDSQDVKDLCALLLVDYPKTKTSQQIRDESEDILSTCSEKTRDMFLEMTEKRR